MIILCKTGIFAQTYQYHPLVDTTTRKDWFYSCFFMYGAMGGGTVVQQPNVLMAGDTLINGLLYREITSSGLVYYDSAYFGAVIEDSSKKVFYKIAGDTTGSIGEAIFDFSLSINDTFSLPDNGDDVIVKVQSIDTIFLAGALRRRVTFFPISSYDTTQIVWIEGIGSLQYGIIATDGYCQFYSDHLCSESENDRLIYSSSYCYPVEDIVNEDVLSFHAFPNPITGICTLEYDGIQTLLSADVYDLTGRRIFPLFEDKIFSNFTFSTASLASGVYLIEVYSAEGKKSVIKLVKE